MGCRPVPEPRNHVIQLNRHNTAGSTVGTSAVEGVRCPEFVPVNGGGVVVRASPGCFVCGHMESVVVSSSPERRVNENVRVRTAAVFTTYCGRPSAVT